MKKIAPFCSAVLIIFTGGCLPLPRERPAHFAVAPKADANFPNRLAVLPFGNSSGNPDGSIILRALVVRKLEQDLGFTLQRMDETDATIRDRTLSGPEIPLQVVLARQDPAILARWLGVEGLLHGKLIDYTKAKVTIYERSHVKAHFWLTDAAGKKLWDTVKDSEEGALAAGSTSIESHVSGGGIPPEALDKMRRSELSEEAYNLVEDAFSGFPRRN